MPKGDPKLQAGVYLVGTTQCDMGCEKCKFARPDGDLITSRDDIVNFVRWAIRSDYLFEWVNVLCGDALLWDRGAEHLRFLKGSGVARKLNLLTCGTSLSEEKMESFAGIVAPVDTIYVLANEKNVSVRLLLRHTLALKRRKVVFVNEGIPISEKPDMCIAPGMTIGGNSAYQCQMAPFVRSLSQVTDKSRPLVSTTIDRTNFLSYFADMGKPAKYVCGACRFNDNLERNYVEPLQGVV
jgi:hypothetical protein